MNSSSFLSLAIFCFIISSFTACQSESKPLENASSEQAALSQSTDTLIGESFNAENFLSLDDIDELAENQLFEEQVIAGKISACCQKKGCWMKIADENNNEMRVTFKDYGFFIPLESIGKEVIVKGKLIKDTVSIEMLQHYAADEGKGEAEIAAIKHPEISMSLIASGVIIKE